MTFYEDSTALSQYLLFHYGKEEEQLPYDFGPKSSLHFPVRCVQECLDKVSLPPNASALDLGCAVGRSSFELSRHCSQVTGIDSSKQFIQAAEAIQAHGQLEYIIAGEGAETEKLAAKIPDDIDFKRVRFKQADALQFLQETTPFHVVLAANLLCRLPDPRAFLQSLKNALLKNGQLILTSPYSWLEAYTPKDKWLKKEEIFSLLSRDFQLQKAFDLSFLIRQHKRKYEWGVSLASTWKKL